MARNIAGYISNLGKSVAYSAVDKVKQMSPTTSEFTSTNAELFKSMYTNIRDYKGTYKRGLDVVQKSKVYEAADLGIKSLFEDIKTGKLYNKEREDRISSKIMGFDSDSGFGSFDSDDMNFDDMDDFGSWDDESVTTGDKLVTASIIDSSRNNADMVSMAIAKSAEHITKTQKSATHLLYTQNLQAYNLFNNNLHAINSNISNILDFSTSTIQNHAQNSTLFFEKTTELLQDQTALLRKIVENTTPKVEQKKESKKKTSFDDLVGVNGTPDLREYFKLINRNISEQLSAISSMNSMFGEDSNALLSVVASPLKFIPNYLINKTIPKTLEKSMERFDKSLSGFFGSLISKFNTMGKDEENLITSTIGKIFGVRNSVKSSIDTANYNKGKVDWDGKSRKALIEVIPTQLSKIISLLSGKDEQIYDYDKGQFVNSKDIKKSYKDIRKSYSKKATSDMKDVFDKYMQNLTFDSFYEKEMFEKDIARFFDQLYSTGQMFDMFGKNSKDGHLEYGIDPKSFALIKTMFKNADKHIQHNINKQILEYRDKENKHMMELENRGDSIYSYTFNNSNLGEFADNKKSKTKGGVLLSAVDNKGRNIFFYLQNIYKELSFIRRFNGSGNGNSSLLDEEVSRIIMPDGTSHTFNRHSLDDIDIPYTHKASTEASKDRIERERKIARFEREQARRRKKNSNLINVSNFDNEAELEKSFSAMIKTNRIKEELEDNKDKKKPLLDRLLEASSISGKLEVVVDNINRLSKKPMDFITNTLDKADQRMYEVIYGKENHKGQDVKGFIDVMILELKSTFGKFNLWLDEKVLEPLKQKLDIETFGDIGKKFLGMFGIDGDEIGQSIKEYLFGKEDGLFTSINNNIKEKFKSTASTVKQSIKDAYGPLFGKIKSGFKGKSKFANLDEVVELSEDIPWEQMTPEQKMKEIQRQRSLDDVIKTTKGISKSSDSYKFDYSKSSFSTYKNHLMAEIQNSQFSNMSRKEKEQLLETLMDKYTDPNKTSRESMYGVIQRLEHELKNEDKIREIDTKIKLRDTVNNRKQAMNTKIANMTRVEKEELLGKLTDEYTDPTKPSKQSSYLMIQRLQNQLNKEDKIADDRYKNTVAYYLKKKEEARNFERIQINENYFNRKSKSAEELYEMFPNLVSSPDIAQSIKDNDNAKSTSVFSSILNKVTEGIDLLKNMKDSLVDIVKSITPKNTKGFGKPSVFNNISTPFSSNPLLREEEGAINDFANELGGIISHSIAGYMHGKLNKFADGGYVKEAQVATIGKGEIVLSKENTDSLIKLLSTVLEDAKESKAKAADRLYGRIKKLDKDLGGFKDLSVLEQLLTQDNRLSGKYNSLSNIQRDDIAKIINAVKGQLDTTRNMKVDERGIPVDPVQRAAFLETRPFLQKVGDEFVNAVSVTRNVLFGNSNDDKKSFGLAIDDITTNITKYAPEAIGSGLMGAGVSLVTGAIGGPLLGAAVGAGVSLTKNSEKVQDWLFGEEDKNGDRTGGVVSKNFMQSVTKYLPDFKTYGIAGAATGLLPLIPFGPVGGLMLGSAFAFAKNNETVQESLFGGKEYSLMKPETKEKLKKMLPRMGLGAGIGMLAGPFGLLGNAIIGSGVGMLSTTHQFERMIIGVKDQEGVYRGGLLPTLRETVVNPIRDYIKGLGKRVNEFVKDKIFKPLQSAFDPIKKDIKLLVGGVFKGIGNTLNKLFEKSFGVPFTKLVEETFQKFTKKVLSPVANIAKNIFKWTIGAPFSLIGAYGKSRRKAHIRSGKADYMTAEERMKFRQENNIYRMGIFGKDKFNKIDQAIVGMDDESVLESVEQLKRVKNIDSDNLKNRKARMRELADIITPYYNYKESKNMTKAVRTGDLKSVAEYINQNPNLSEKVKKQLISSLEKKNKEIDQIENKDKKSIYEELRKKGLDVNDKNIDKYINLLSSENKARKGKSSSTEEKPVEEQQLDLQEKNHNEIVDLFKQVIYILKGNDSLSFDIEKAKDSRGQNGVSETIKNVTKSNKDEVIEKIDDDGSVRKYRRNKKGDLVYDKSDHNTVKEIKQEQQEEEKRNIFYDKFSSLVEQGKLKAGEVVENTKQKTSSMFSTLKNFFSGGGLFKIMTIAGAIMAIPGASDFIVTLAQPIVQVGIKLVTSAIPLIATAIKDMMPTITENFINIMNGVATSIGFDDGLKDVGEAIVDSGTRDIVRGTGRIGKWAVRNASKGGIVNRILKYPLKKVGEFETKVAKDYAKVPIKTRVENLGRNINTIKNVASKMGKKASKVANAALEKAPLIKSIVDTVTKFIKNLFNNHIVKAIIGSKKANKFITKALPRLIELITKTASKSSVKALTRMIGGMSTGGFMTVAWAVGDFVSGFNDAENILGIIEEPTFAMKFSAGCIKALNGFITLGFVPEKTLVNFFVDIVYPIMSDKADDSKLRKLRQEAVKTVDKYAEENGISKMTVEEYNKETKKSLWEKTVDGTKSFFSKVGKKISSGWKGLWGKGDSHTTKKTNTVRNINLGGNGDKPSFAVNKKVLNVDKDNKKKNNKNLAGNGDSFYDLPASTLNTLSRAGKNNIDKVLGGNGKEDIRYMELNAPIKEKVTAKDINNWINPIVKNKSGSALKDIGDVAIKAHKETGLDPRYLVAHAAWESAWGTSNYAKNRNNFFGIGAFNSNPDKALTFSKEEGFIDGAKWINHNFIKEGQNTLDSMINEPTGTHRYAVYDDGSPNEGWVQGISSIMSGSNTIKSGSINKNAKWSGNWPTKDYLTSGSSAKDGSNNTSVDSGDSNSGEDNKKNNTIFNMFSELGTALSNDFNRLFGFEPETTDSEDNNNNTSSKKKKKSKKKDNSATKYNDFVYYSQNEAPWATHDYNISPGKPGAYPGRDVSIKTRGCGPTSAAMVIRELTGDSEVNPATMADLSTSTGSSVNAGTAWDFFARAGTKHGLNVMQYSKSSTVDKLSNVTPENPMIISGEGGINGSRAPFYGGHFVVGVKGSKDNIIINDPVGRNTSKSYKIKDIAPLVLQGWSFDKGGNGEDKQLKEKPDPKPQKIALPEQKIPAGNGPRESTSSKIYEKLLLSIIDVLMKISDNSSYLSKIVDILSEKLGVIIPEETKKSIRNNTSGSKQQIVNLLRQSASENNNNDNEYLLNLLDNLAKQ